MKSKELTLRSGTAFATTGGTMSPRDARASCACMHDEMQSTNLNYYRAHLPLFPLLLRILLCLCYRYKNSDKKCFPVFSALPLHDQTLNGEPCVALKKTGRVEPRRNDRRFKKILASMKYFLFPVSLP